MQTIEQIRVGSACCRPRDKKSSAGQCLYKTFNYTGELGEECGLVASVASSADGNVISRRVLHTLTTKLCRIGSGEQTRQVSPNWPALIREAFDQANMGVYKEDDQRPCRQVMGVSLTSVVIAGDALYIGHAGDNRAYLIRNRQISRLTKDHIRTDDQAREDMSSNQCDLLTKAIGKGKSVQPDVDAVGLLPGDRIVLCTAGTTRRLSDTDTLLAACSSMDAHKAARALMLAAGTVGEHGNPAFILIDCDGGIQHSCISIPAILTRLPRWAIAVLAITIGLLLANAAFLGNQHTSSSNNAMKTEPEVRSGHHSKPDSTLLDLSGRPVKIMPMR